MHKSGFSLVELSIVLVILGLLTGGILGGQSLIHAAELRAVSTELAAWQTAVNAFKQKYNAYPGDFSMATKFWGTDPDCPGSYGDVLTQTCNGTGNGVVAKHDGGGVEESEAFLFWQHLSKAGLITGSYTGVRGSASPWGIDAGENGPASKFSGGAWAIDSYSDHTDYFYNVDTKNALLFGAPGEWEVVYDPLLTPEDAWNIDSKLDDGRPGRGSVLALHYHHCDDAANRNDFDGDYKLGVSSKECGLIFLHSI